MKWTITQLQKFRDKKLELDEYVDVSDIKELDTQIRDASPMHITGRADISSSKVTFHLHIKGKLILPCSRTLVDVEFPIDIETIETFLLNTAYDVSDAENAFAVEGDTIDLLPVIKENILIEIPIQVFCDDTDSEDAAPQSGKDWEVVTEEDQKKKIDPRLAKLANFFNDENNNS
ncbi:YceD family protein [Peribacillus kribbensis]|uniref:YceD family protein n=1 Tax=Peribacillus kribbensis TaxID=356658 RepID=UPI000402CC82|nr:YceD family protein [Peribacillus kribbensis]